VFIIASEKLFGLLQGLLIVLWLFCLIVDGFAQLLELTQF
jgi:hypothetical protein